jgi:2-phospho-L-lactate guanylyltransferase
VVIPLRAAGTGKTRLQGATREPAAHGQLVLAIQRDAIEAVLVAARRSNTLPGSPIAGVHLVTERAPDGLGQAVHVIADNGGGLNAALRQAAGELAERWPSDGVLAMVADLPALRPQEILDVLDRASNSPTAYVADAQGSGTTMLAARRPRDLDPQFGAGSAGRHEASGCLALAAGPGARQDVDTALDLARCLRLGVGANTAAMLSELQPFG